MEARAELVIKDVSIPLLRDMELIAADMRALIVSMPPQFLLGHIGAVVQGYTNPREWETSIANLSDPAHAWPVRPLHEGAASRGRVAPGKSSR